MADINPQDLEQFISNLTRTNVPLSDLEKAAQAATNATYKQNAEIAKTIQYFKDLGSAVVSTDHGTAKYGRSVTTLTDAIGNQVAQYGVLGQVVGNVIKLFGGLASASLKQNDALIKTYRSLSEFGNIDFNLDGVEKLNNDLLSIGTTAENAAYFVQLIGKIAPDLAAFKGTVTQGKDAFLELNSKLLNNKFENQLKNLGYTTEDITNISGRYVGQLSRVGIAQGKSTDQLRDKSFNYMVVLQQLSDLTGLSRDKLQEQIDEQNRDLAFRAYMRTLSKEEADRASEVAQAFSAFGGKEVGNVVREMMELRGGVRTAKAAMMQSYMPDLWEAVQKSMVSKDPFGTAGKELQKRAGAFNENITTYAHGVAIGGDETGKALEQSIDLYDAAERLQGLQNVNIDEYTANLKKQMSQDKGRLALGTQQEQNERRMQAMYEKMKFAIGDLAVPAITKFTTALNAMGLGLAKFTKLITGGKVDFISLFETFDTYGDTVNAINEEDRTQLALIDKRAKAEEALNDLLVTKSKQEKEYSSPKITPVEREKLLSGVNDAIAKAREDVSAVNEQVKTSKMRQQSARAAQSILAEGATVSEGTSKEGLEGIRMKGGAAGAMAPGATISPKLAELAQKLAKGIPEYTYISSMNDEYHKGTNSAHAKGLALDFTLPNRPSEKEAQEYIKKLKSMGATKVLDEYNHPSDGATAGHMHVEVARKGGMFNGPGSGYPVMLHGKETVLPTKALDNLVSKLPLPGTLFGDTNSNSQSTDDLVAAMNGVQGSLDSLADTFRRSLGVQEDILTHTKMLA